MSPIVLPKEHFGAMFGGKVSAYTLVIDNGKFLLVQRAKEGRTGGRTGEWDLPGGKAVIAESPQAAARRVTKEETGLDVQVREPLTMISRLESKITMEALVIMIFRATIKTPGDISLSREHKAYKWVTKKELASLSTVSYVQSAVESAESQGFL